MADAKPQDRKRRKSRPTARAIAWVLAGLLPPACGVDTIVHEIEPDCICTQPGDRCFDGACLQPGRTCNSTSGCTAPYLCNLDNERCTCDPSPDSWSACAPRCDSGAPCPTNTDCDEASGLCLPPLQCLTDAVCADDETCASGQRFLGVVWDGNDGYSVAQSRRQACAPGDRAPHDGCRRGEDCAAGDCVVSGINARTCETTEICGPADFRIHALSTTCYLHQACRKDLECPDGYTCRLFEVESSGYCGRAA